LEITFLESGRIILRRAKIQILV